MMQYMHSIWWCTYMRGLNLWVVIVVSNIKFCLAKCSPSGILFHKWEPKVYYNIWKRFAGGVSPYMAAEFVACILWEQGHPLVCLYVTWSPRGFLWKWRCHVSSYHYWNSSEDGKNACSGSYLLHGKISRQSTTPMSISFVEIRASNSYKFSTF